MSTTSTRKRTSAKSASQKVARVTITMDVSLYAKVCAAAALKSTDRSALISSILADALRSFIVFEKVDVADKRILDTQVDRETRHD